jgi:response regulator NasT
MLYSEVHEYKPKSFELLLVASMNHWEDCQDNDIVCAAMPIKVNDLIATIEMMQQAQIRRRRKLRSQPRRRSQEEQKVIDDAKEILMEKNNMSEPEAFRYIQKCSMDSGNTMVESASMVIGIYSDML